MIMTSATTDEYGEQNSHTKCMCDIPTENACFGLLYDIVVVLFFSAGNITYGNIYLEKSELVPFPQTEVPTLSEK